MKNWILLFLILLTTVTISIESVHGQTSPNITYNTPQPFTTGVAISTLSPSNTGGAVYPANYSSPITFTPYTTPFSIAVDASNNVYTTNNSTGDLTKHSPSGAVLFTVNTGTVQASGVGVDGAGNIYVSQFTINSILKYNSSGTLIATIPGFSDPYGIAFDASNNAYVANYANGNILEIAANSTTVTTYASGLNTPYGITMDAAGNMYVSEQSVGDVVKIASGTLTKTVIASGFNGPRHLNKDQFGNIYVADYGNNAIQRISPTGVVTGILTNGLTNPRQAAFDASGNLFIADYGTNTLKKSIATAYSISSALPAGLNFDTTTGQISGTPTVVTAPTTYTITAYNTGGSSSTTITISVVSPTQSSSIPPPTVSIAAATSISENGATLNGTANSNGNNTTVSFTYGLNSNLAGATTATATTGGNLSAAGNNNAALSISGLNPATTYYYAITATNSAGAVISSTGSFTTLALTSQSINFSALPVKTYGNSDFNPGASASSGGTIVYTSDNPSVATIVNGEIHITGAGSANITANQPGTSGFTSATSVSQLLTVNKANQTIKFADIPNQVTGTTYDLSTVSASSGLPVSFTSGNTFLGTINGSLFTSLHAGTTTVTALQLGNNNYNADSVKVTVIIINPVDNEIIVHQALSPNGDGKNDFLLIEGIQNFHNKVTIINRNGGKVFETNDYDNNTHVFNGHSNVSGALQQQGTYFYLIEYTDANNQNKRKSGFFILRY